jgi:hypothetical protein
VILIWIDPIRKGRPAGLQLGGAESRPVYVSVGIDPPNLPRNGAGDRLYQQPEPKTIVALLRWLIRKTCSVSCG